MLAEMNHQMWKDYPELGDEKLDIHVVDGGPHLLGPMSDKSHRAAFDILTQLGVHVHLNELVKRYEYESVYLSSGHVETSTLIWFCGRRSPSF